MSDIKSGMITTTGFAYLEKALLGLPDKLAQNVLRGAIRAGAVIMQQDARARAPQSAKQHIQYKNGKPYAAIQPGHLKKSILVRLAPRKSRDRPVEYWVYVSPRAFYWHFIEFGTKKMSAKPFMRRAFETNKQESLDRMKEYLAARIEKELRG